MTGRASENKEVPDGVIVGELLPRKKDDSDGVGKSARDEEPDSSSWELGDHLGQDGNDEPAHDDVERGGCPVLAVATHEGFGENTTDGEEPDDAEDAPTEGAAHGDEGEGGVGARDEEVDGGVVKDLKELFDLVTAEAVIERRGEVENNHSAPEDGTRYHGPSVLGDDAHEDEAGDRGEDANSMCDGRGEFFAWSIAKWGACFG